MNYFEECIKVFDLIDGKEYLTINFNDSDRVRLRFKSPYFNLSHDIQLITSPNTKTIHYPLFDFGISDTYKKVSLSKKGHLSPDSLKKFRDEYYPGYSIKIHHNLKTYLEETGYKTDPNILVLDYLNKNLYRIQFKNYEEMIHCIQNCKPNEFPIVKEEGVWNKYAMRLTINTEIRACGELINDPNELIYTNEEYVLYEDLKNEEMIKEEENKLLQDSENEYNEVLVKKIYGKEKTIILLKNDIETKKEISKVFKDTPQNTDCYYLAFIRIRNFIESRNNCKINLNGLLESIPEIEKDLRKRYPEESLYLMVKKHIKKIIQD